MRVKVIVSSDDSIEIKRSIILRYINQVKQDEVYKSIQKNVGILPLNILKHFSSYDCSLKNFLDSLKDHAGNYSGMSLGNLKTQENLAFQIIINSIDGSISMILLSKQVLRDEEEFEIHKQFLVNEYWRLKDAIRQGEVLPSIIFNSFIQIEEVFNQIGILNELNIHPDSEKSIIN